MADVFDLTMTLRSGYGPPPDHVSKVLVDGAVWHRLGDNKWGQVYEWGRLMCEFAPETAWIEAPRLALPPPSHAWHDIGGRRWAYAYGLFTTPDAPPTTPPPCGWSILDEASLAIAHDMVTRPPGADYPKDRRFKRRMFPILRAGDRLTLVDFPGPPCAVWRNGLLIAIVMPLDLVLGANDGKTLAEILEVPNVTP